MSTSYHSVATTVASCAFSVVSKSTRQKVTRESGLTTPPRQGLCQLERSLGGGSVKVAARVIGGDRRDADLRVLTNRRDHCERFLDRESIGRLIQIDLSHFWIEHVEIEVRIDAVHTRGDVVERRCCVALGQRRSWSRMSLGQSILAWREAQARTEAAPIWLSGFAIGG